MCMFSVRGAGTEAHERLLYVISLLNIGETVEQFNLDAFFSGLTRSEWVAGIRDHGCYVVRFSPTEAVKVKNNGRNSG